MSFTEKLSEPADLWSEDDVEEFETEGRHAQRASRQIKYALGACIVILLLFLSYAKSPLHIKNCVHHINKHAHSIGTIQGKTGVQEVAEVQTRGQSGATAVNLEKRQNTTSVCTTAACTAYAKSIKDNFAKNYTSIDPCTDFSTYACGGWRDGHDFRPDQSSVSVGSLMADFNRNLLHSVMEGAYSENTTFTGENRTLDKANFDKMKTTYNACMNEDAIKAYGVTPLRKILDEFETVYPLNGSKSSNEELTSTVIWLAKNAVSGLVSANSGADDKNPDIVILSLGSGEVGLSKQYYNKSVVLTNYTRAIAETIHVITNGKPIYEDPIPASKNVSLYDLAKKIVGFEKRLSDHMPVPEQASNVTYGYQLFPVSHADKLVPEISVSNYLKAQSPSGYPITLNRTVIISDINFYNELSEIIKTTPRDTLHAYFQWRLIATYQGRLHKNFTAPMRRFSNRLGGRDENTISERWRTCLSEVDSGLSSLYSAAFIERAFTQKDKALGDRIILDIKSVFSERLRGFDWMSDKVKDTAARKVVNIIQKIGYQTSNPNVADPKDVSGYYANLKVTDNYFENALSYYRFGYNKSWEDLLKPVDRNRWGMSAPTVNAYYNPSGNEIVFPAGIMQLPVFSSDLPEYVSYGSFGAVAGHELTHGFDNHGSQYDENGVLRNWWDNQTLSSFEKKTKCFVDQYEKFTVPGLEAGEVLHVNGKLTLGENIADAGGLTAAYTAWKKRDKLTPNQQLPGLEKFSNDQLFFVSYSNWWCGKVRKEQAVSYIYSDPHSPADKRIIGTLDNSEAFKNAFNCAAKQPTCEVW